MPQRDPHPLSKPSHEEIVENVNYYHREHEIFTQQLKDTEKKIDDFHYLHDKLQHELDLTVALITRNKDKLSQYTYLSGDSVVATLYLEGMYYDLNSSETSSIVRDLEQAVEKVKSTMEVMKGNLPHIKSKIIKSAQNYDYWYRLLGC